MSSQADEALSIATTFMDALARRDLDTLFSLVHDQIVLEVAYPFVKGEDTTGAGRQTREAVRTYLQDMKQRTAQIRFNNVIWRTTNDGLAIFQADGDVTLSDGRPYPNHYLFMFGAADGKIIYWREYLNPVNAVRAFGAPLESLP
jgi:ketosteroid isomerase-like protein